MELREKLQREADELEEQDRLRKEAEAAELEKQLLAEHAEPEEDDGEGEDDEDQNSEETPLDQQVSHNELAGLEGELQGNANEMNGFNDEQEDLVNSPPETQEEVKGEPSEELKID